MGLVRKQADDVMPVEPKPTIFVDYGEEIIAKMLESQDCEVVRMRLATGDFVISDEIAVERKGTRDFLASIFDGRLFEQMARLKEEYARPFIIVEGLHGHHQDNNSIRGAILSIATDFGIPIIWANDERETATFLLLAAKRELKPKKGFAGIARRKPKTNYELQLYVVSSLPGIGQVKAKKLLEKFKTVEKVFKASEKQLAKVIGEKNAKKLKEILILQSKDSVS